MRFRNRVVIITGAGAGIGEVMARMFAEEGAAVVAVDWHGEAAEATAGEIDARGGQALALRTDVSVADDVDEMLTRTLNAFGQVDVLVNNAAVAQGDDVLQIDAATWDHDVGVVLRGPFLCSRAVLTPMIERQRGVVVNIASVNGLAAFGNESYSAAKAGMINLTQSIAMRYGRYGIRANAIAPGTIRTNHPTWQARLRRDPQVFERLAKWYPLGRVGEPEDVAKAALFLASEDAAWVSGALLRVDGGLLAGNPVMTHELLTLDGEHA